MVTIEISDESIMFIIIFISLSFFFGWFFVQWDLNRMRKKLKKEREQWENLRR